MNKKKIIALFLGCTILGQGFTANVQAANINMKEDMKQIISNDLYEINSVDQLKESLTKIHKESNRSFLTENSLLNLRNDLINNTNPEVLNEYVMQMQNEIQEKLSELPPLNIDTTKQTHAETTRDISLSDGGILKVTSSITKKDTDKNIVAPFGGYLPGEYYSAGEYLAWNVIQFVNHVFYIDTILSFGTDFFVDLSVTQNRKNIENLSSDFRGTQYVYPVKVNRSYEEYKSNASTAGDFIGSKATFNLAFDKNGSDVATMVLILNNKVKINSISTSGCNLSLYDDSQIIK